MPEQKEIGSGQEYPTLEIGGVKYTVKFSRGLLYRMGKAGVVFAPQVINQGTAVTMPFHQLVDVLTMAISWPGDNESLAELVYPIRGDAVAALMQAWGKAFPAPRPTLQETPATREAVQ